MAPKVDIASILKNKRMFLHLYFSKAFPLLSYIILNTEILRSTMNHRTIVSVSPQKYHFTSAHRSSTKKKKISSNYHFCNPSPFWVLSSSCPFSPLGSLSIPLASPSPVYLTAGTLDQLWRRGFCTIIRKKEKEGFFVVATWLFCLISSLSFSLHWFFLNGAMVVGWMRMNQADVHVVCIYEYILY